MGQDQNSNFNKDESAKKESFTHKAGDKIERLGEKISGKLGEKIRNVGDRIEHSRDNK